ncbi:MAG: ABC-type transport auxiliary lipoprotein family protein [Spirochaetales bacterium]
MKRLIILAAVVFVAGCNILPEAREAYYYAIEYEPPSDVPEPAEIDTARILEPQVSPAYDRRQIVLRGDSARYQYLSDDMWGVELGAALQLLFERFYEDVPTFTAVRGEFDTADAQYEIHMAVRRVEYVQGDPPRTRVELLYELRESGDDGTTLARHTTDYNEPTGSNGGLEQFVADVNRIMLDSISAFDTEIRENLAASPNNS